MDLLQLKKYLMGFLKKTIDDDQLHTFIHEANKMCALHVAAESVRRIMWVRITVLNWAQIYWYIATENI